jgi:uncharacterized metal-binding protein (TIGR02443 family)
VTRRRFIAGAVCPRCSAVDRIVLEDADRRRRCVACGFTDALPSGSGVGSTPVGKLDGRRRTATSTTPETVVRVVTSIDASSDRSLDDQS